MPITPDVRLEQMVTACDQNICFNGGSCYIVSQTGFICFCPMGFTGDMCQFCMFSIYNLIREGRISIFIFPYSSWMKNRMNEVIKIRRIRKIILDLLVLNYFNIGMDLLKIQLIFSAFDMLCLCNIFANQKLKL